MGLFDEPTFNPTVVDGVRSTAAIVSGRIKPDYADEIYSYQPNGNAMALLLVEARKKRKVSQYQYNFLQKDRYPYRDKINLAAGYDADDVSVVVDNGDRFYPRCIVFVPRTKERFLVDSISTNTLTLEKRGLGNTAQPLLDNDELVIIGDAYPENADVGTAKSIKETVTFNYTHTIRTPFNFSGREMNTDMFGGPDMKTEEKWQASEHTQKIEKVLFWSARDLFTASSPATPNTTTGGLHYWVKDQNEWALNGIPFNHKNLVEYLEYGMYYGRGGRFGSRTKWLFGSSAFMTQIESWGHDIVRLVPSDSVLGLKVKKIQTTHGDLMLVDHPLFEGENRDKAFMVDMNHIRYVYHQGRDTQLRRDIALKSIDGKTHEIMTDCGIEVTLPLSHGFWHGLSV